MVGVWPPNDILRSYGRRIVSFKLRRSSTRSLSGTAENVRWWWSRSSRYYALQLQKKCSKLWISSLEKLGGCSLGTDQVGPALL